MSARRITSQFASDLLAGSLAELRARRAKLEAFIVEAGELDTAIREMERVVSRLGIGTQPARPALAAVPDGQPHTPASPGAVREGTNADRALTLLREHPRGLNTTVIAEQAKIAQGSISVVLQALADRGDIVKVGRGFWRVNAAA